MLTEPKEYADKLMSALSFVPLSKSRAVVIAMFTEQVASGAWAGVSMRSDWTIAVIQALCEWEAD